MARVRVRTRRWIGVITETDPKQNMSLVTQDGMDDNADPMQVWRCCKDLGSASILQCDSSVRTRTSTRI